MSDSMFKEVRSGAEREIPRSEDYPEVASRWERPQLDEIRIVMDLPEGAEVIFDRPIAYFFTYWIQLLAPFLLGHVWHALSREFFSRQGHVLEA